MAEPKRMEDRIRESTEQRTAELSEHISTELNKTILRCFGLMSAIAALGIVIYQIGYENGKQSTIPPRPPGIYQGPIQK